MSSALNRLRRTAHLPDAALAALVMAIVGMMIIPLPTTLLDLLIAGNVTVSVLMLLVSLHGRDGLAFSAMPTVLLITTLYRLALNVSSTRLILLQADAGEIIASFGNFVVRGDYVVGGVIFLILTLIQFLVVARGSERVAEVFARFTLDAIPGKQLAIDADVRSGLAGPEQARRMRQELERESQFYGAMDGAMKFVKGDAIAGIVITAINLVAGVGIGMGARDMSLLDSLRIYGLLTIGDGLVSQLPSLLVSTSAGVVVTRVAGENEHTSLAQQVGHQLFGDRRVLRAGALFLFGLSLVPGLPALPFLGMGVLTAGASLLPAPLASPGQRPPAPGDSLPGAEASLYLGIGVQVTASEATWLRARLGLVGGRLRDALGVPVPTVQLGRGDGPAGPLDPRGYQLALHGMAIAAGRVPEGGRDATASLDEPLYRALLLHARTLIDLQTTQRLLDALEAREPARVRHVVPARVSLPELRDLLRRLLDEQISIRALGTILEAAGSARGDPGQPVTPDTWYERLRKELGPRITHGLSTAGVLRVHALDPAVEEALDDDCDTAHTPRPASPGLTEDLVTAARRLPARKQGPVVVLVADRLRPLLRAALAPELPEIRVISYGEIAPELVVEYAEPIVP